MMHVILSYGAQLTKPVSQRDIYFGANQKFLDTQCVPLLVECVDDSWVC